MSPRTSHAELTPAPGAAALARRHTRAAATTWGVTPEVIDNAELAVSELVTNALLHAIAPASDGAPAPPIGLTVCQVDGLLRLEVTDADPTPPRFADPASDAEDGRGLLIIAALAKQWGYARLLGGGKAVWCELSDT